MSIHQPVRLKLRTLGVHNITHLAPVVAHPLLLGLVKDVEPARQGIVQVLHIASRMQGLPGTGARLALARLEHEEQRVQTRDNLLEGDSV